MKKVAFTLIALSIATVFTACKNESSEPETLQKTKDLAVADTTPTTETDFLYVTAPSGLTLREMTYCDHFSLSFEFSVKFLLLETR